MISPQPVRASEAGMRAKRSTSRRRRVVRRREYAARPVRRLMGANRRARLTGDAGEVLGGGAVLRRAEPGTESGSRKRGRGGRRLMGANRRARLMGDAGEVLGGGAVLRRA